MKTIVSIFIFIFMVSAQAQTGKISERFRWGELSAEIEVQTPSSAIYQSKLRSLKNYLNHDFIPKVPLAIIRIMDHNHLKINFVPISEDVAHFNSALSDSGHRERIIEIPLSYLAGSIESYDQLLVHELFHVFHDILRPEDNHWAKEGLAQLFQFQVTRKHTMQNIASGFQTITTPLIHNLNPYEMSSAHYGHSALYFLYLKKECFLEEFVWDYLAHEGQTSSEVIDDLLRTKGGDSEICSSFVSSVMNFEVARVYNRPYVLGQDLDSYFILSSVFSPAPEVINQARVLRRKLNELAPFVPLYVQVAGSNVLLNNLPADVMAKYINLNFPYEIADSPFSDREQLTLFIKIPGSD